MLRWAITYCKYVIYVALLLTIITTSYKANTFDKTANACLWIKKFSDGTHFIFNVCSCSIDAQILQRITIEDGNSTKIIPIIEVHTIPAWNGNAGIGNNVLNVSTKHVKVTSWKSSCNVVEDEQAFSCADAMQITDDDSSSIVYAWNNCNRNIQLQLMCDNSAFAKSINIA